MIAHNGMRPQDVVILCKIVLWENRSWQYRDIAVELDISLSEVSQSLARNALAGLYLTDRKKVARNGLFEFIKYGLHYVFPANRGPIVIGIPTAHSHPYFKEKIVSNEIYVWPDPHGQVRGQGISPLYKGTAIAAAKDEDLYKLLASIDILRVGKRREIQLALNVLEEYLL
ncbi:hypothetical protein SAMN05216327_1265 [Dyadobacter sp. SG02]|uniref:hypothetical protein n=1 Tax=Dyadobacter sp. SG02 TaxID=1855291 RepID=UPI0008C57670|nr:hypothetical protein [Dyadobacter sp. SG02]SEJ85260.1 hypothetical protein SAMN05216327_1265 [Dyadobacter sp. SG02]